MSKIRIENSPELRSFSRMAFEWGFTSFMWALWLYLFMPLVSVILWVVGIRYVYLAFFQSAAFQQLIDMMERMGWAVAVIFIVLRGWGYYNFYVFGRRNRRKMHTLPSNVELGQHVGLTAEEVWKLQQQTEIVWEPLYEEMIKAQTLRNAVWDDRDHPRPHERHMYHNGGGQEWSDRLRGSEKS